MRHPLPNQLFSGSRKDRERKITEILRRRRWMTVFGQIVDQNHKTVLSTLHKAAGTIIIWSGEVDDATNIGIPEKEARLIYHAEGGYLPTPEYEKTRRWLMAATSWPLPLVFCSSQRGLQAHMGRINE